MEAFFEKIAERLIVGKIDEVKELSQQALDQGASPRDIIDKGLLAGMDVVGKRFKAGDMFIPEVLLCARCMHGAMDILKPLLSEADSAGTGIYVIGTVEGDLHDIGKNLVSMMLQGAGFEVIDSFDAALTSDPETPWYLPLLGEPTPIGLRRGRLGRRIARRTIGILESLRIAPKGSKEVSQMLGRAAEALA